MARVSVSTALTFVFAVSGGDREGQSAALP
jgi:hypothetical protein